MATTTQQPTNTPEGPAERAPRPGSGFRALRNRNFRLLWGGQLVSQIGTWMQTTAQAWLVLELTGSPFALGFVSTLQFLPFTLLSLFGGLIADRFPKRKLLLITQILGLVQAVLFALLVTSGLVALWQIYLLAVLQGIITAIDNPVRQAIIGELVDRDDMVNAVGLVSVQFNAARIVGPALAGLLIAWLGNAPVLWINAASFLAAIAGLAMMQPTSVHTRPHRPHGQPLKQLFEGVSYALRTPIVLLALLVVAFIGTFGYNFNTMLPLLARFVLHTDAVGFGALTAAFGVGSLLGALRTAAANRVSVRRLLLASASFSVILALLALTPVLALSMLLLVALGFAGVTFGTTANSLVQLNVPDELRGRVMSLYILLFIGSTPVGALLSGILSEQWGVQAALLVAAGLCALGVVVALAFARKAGL
ncbi:MAG: MFS transporter [Roseiflexaceae bacterium]|nr:MFS transporter [Roseiflexaceae bacterium]